MSVSWVFDPAPPSGKRTGGNAAEYTFIGRIDTLVREVVQNSLDARREDNVAVDIRFRIIDLTGEHLEEFLAATSWSSLEDNLQSVPEKRGGRAIRHAMELMEAGETLRLLVVEDHGTRGLEGTEQRRNDDERNSFCALVRDELYSDKAREDSAGSFGLGKSLLWAYSSLKTVLFSSIPFEPPDGKTGTRFIGRTSLPYHETSDDGACSGDGWLGVERGKGARRNAESVWGAVADKLARATHSSREMADAGLSTVIVGFAEPGEEDREPADILDAIVKASLGSFWPSISRGYVRIEVTRETNGQVHETRNVFPQKVEGYQSLHELLEQFSLEQLSEKEALGVGQSAVSWVPIEIPARTLEPTHPAFTGKVAVLVTLIGDEDDTASIRDRVYRFRRPGLVIRSDQRRNLSIGARPFIACVVAGAAAGLSEEHQRVEHFLRAAEPQGHDEWTHNTRAIKETYKEWGCKSKLARLEKAILKAIRSMVSAPEEKGGALSRALLQHLRFGGTGGGGSARFLSVTGTNAEVSDGRWNFSARCRRVRADDKPWHVVIRMKYAIDGGGGADVHAIVSVNADKGAVRTEVRNGVGLIEFAGDVSRASIHGETGIDLLPAVGTNAAVRLRIDGRSGSIPDA